MSNEKKPATTPYIAPKKSVSQPSGGNLQAQVDALQARLDAVKVIPDNAVTLIASVKGISDDMAKKALDALTSGTPSDGK